MDRFTRFAAITKSDTANFGAGTGTPDCPCDSIYVGGAGVVAVVAMDGTVTNFTCVAGQVLNVRAKRVNSTNTTATLLVALYTN